MNDKEREAMQQALWALEQLGYGGSYAAIDLREALAEQARQNIGDGVMLTAMQHPHNCCVLVDDISEDSIEHVEQAEQEPVAWIDNKTWCFTYSQYEYEDLDDDMKDDLVPLYAAPVRTKNYNPDVLFNDDGTFSLTLPDGDELRIIPPQQEPTAEVTEEGYAWGEDGILPAGTKLYAAPVRTKDLTDDEIYKLADDVDWAAGAYLCFARAVIQEFRRKNGIV